MVQHMQRHQPKFYIQATPCDGAPWCSCVRNGGGLIERWTSLVCLCTARGVTPRLVLLLEQAVDCHTVTLSLSLPQAAFRFNIHSVVKCIDRRITTMKNGKTYYFKYIKKSKSVMWTIILKFFRMSKSEKVCS